MYVCFELESASDALYGLLSVCFRRVFVVFT